jgi:alanine racemase
MPFHWIEISKSALISNLQLYRQAIHPDTKIMSVVKANAYGHGLEQVTPIVAPHSDFLMVNTIDEALKIKNLKTKVFIAAPVSPVGLKHNFSLCAHSLDYLKQLSIINSPFSIHLKINTGTNRLGLQPSEIPSALEIIHKSKLIVEGIYTHFHSSDSGSPATQKQFRIFQTVVQKVRTVYPDVLSHCASSSASLLLPPTRLNMIRLGISLYGLWPDQYVQNHSPGKTLKPVLSWKCHPVQIRWIRPGETISYAATHKYKKTGVMAVLPIGYSDGYDRKLSNYGRVWAAGKYYPVIGRVAMNFTMIDITGTNLSCSDEVELIGPHVTADEIAAKIGTINYEVVSRISPFIPRIIVK